jgi:hypothetical protein
MPDMNDSQSKTPDVAGVLFGLATAAGCAWVVWEAWGYGVGTPRRMGPGFFPVLLGAGGVVLGLLMAWRGSRRSFALGEEVPLRRLGFIGAAFVLFAVAIQPIGLVVTLFGATLLGAMADADARPVQTLILAAGLALAIWIVFVELLGLAIPVWPVVF